VKQTCILILGMHRSGTSAFTGILEMLDVSLGNKLLEANEANAKGYFENEEIFKINEYFLSELNSSWHDVFFHDKDINKIKDLSILKNFIVSEFKDREIFAIKDPRITFLFPLYKRVLTELNIDIKIVVPYREAYEVAKSIEKRDQISFEKALYLWTYHILMTHKHTKEFQRYFFNYSELLQDPQKIYLDMFEHLSLDLKDNFLKKRHEITKFLEPTMQHNKVKEHLDNVYPNIIQHLMQALNDRNDTEFEYCYNDFFNNYDLFYHKEIKSLIPKIVLSRNTIKEKNELILQREEVLKEKNELILQREKVIKEKNELINQKNLLFEEREDLYRKQEQKLKELLYKKELEAIRYKDLAESLRLKNRLKRSIKKIGIDESSLLYKTVKSLKNEGFTETVEKIKNKLSEDTQVSIVESLTDKRVKSTKKIINIEEEIENHVNKKTIQVPKKQPLVSIIVLTRNGLEYMKVLLKAIAQNTLYNNYEVIIVDNASSDQTLAFLEQNSFNLPLTIIKNSENLSFSRGNNQAVEVANGELLLFLNNDTKPLKGWLCSLVQEFLANPKMGSAGSKLIYPYKDGFENSCTIQHSGISFRYEGDFYRPYNLGNSKKYLLEDNKTARAAITAACLLVPKRVFEEVEGFDERYIYGYEDVDLGLKILSKGYENIYIPDSILYHYEFGTQNKNKNDEVRKRRLNNIKLFKKKWHQFLKRKYWSEKLHLCSSLFSEEPLHIALAVSNKGEGIAEGDYFTAKELATELEALGYKVSYLSRKHNEWYDFLEDIDIVVTLIDKYDIGKIRKTQKKIIYIAWLRNWFDRWISHKFFEQYDFILASSKEACKFVEQNSKQKAIYFPIATNHNCFFNGKKQEKYISDYCFTGSYWNDEREIIRFLNPENLSYKFHIYGKNWEKIEKFQSVFKGFLSYENMPDVYASTKIVIDDANRVTKPYGAVNSRVFDALCAGCLVLTNGVIGARTEFDDLLPSFSSQEELEYLLKYYLENDHERLELVKKLQNKVLNEHTYRYRALRFKEILEEEFLKDSIVIKIPAPNWDVIQEWGDYHFAKSMKKEFEKIGYRVLLQVLNEWDNAQDLNYDNVLVLRGLSQYKLKDHHFNIMWNISHPDKVSKLEYSMYDFIYVASIKWAQYLQNSLDIEQVMPLLQCSDTDLFYPVDMKEDIELLFVGNSRKIFRKVIQWILPTKYNLEIYGSNWEKFVDHKYIRAQNIPNGDLYTYYNRAKIVLNDHWDDMREKGFISNRIFDVSACGKFILTDDVQGLEDIFGDAIVVYKDKEDLQQKIEYYLTHDEERYEKAKKAMEITRSLYSFSLRVKEIDKMLKNKDRK